MSNTAPSRSDQLRSETRHAGAVVYFSSTSENTTRFVESCRFDELNIATYRIPLRAGDEPLAIREPYVLIVPTYGGGVVAKAVPPQVKRFLNDPDNRAWIRGVIASGNTNFGEAYGAAGRIVSAKCKVPLLFTFELMGTPEDVRKTRDGLARFFAQRQSHEPHQH
ncbi:class Ib ribonucleoside-diphosphate reductase assembly flavoprotein NrdI [Bifidobacterium ramosum]|uniref:Protein NrdI n=1 Tax=Bifidobacterium ramosum TaxID=1798158 RepID=A0A7K3TAY6_9BIFI|nr:class Ib ribonucleoside-diphosphate reductase assembly flavoprotein NrdI [Bifidobacterium ramosum]NEG71642.1 class Ib ribonucleoside-diphosphate reductase assembly flavoprotein NrdI [Bifidobacterium ramosum]